MVAVVDAISGFTYYSQMPRQISLVIRRRSLIGTLSAVGGRWGGWFFSRVSSRRSQRCVKTIAVLYRYYSHEPRCITRRTYDARASTVTAFAKLCSPQSIFSLAAQTSRSCLTWQTSMKYVDEFSISLRQLLVTIRQLIRYGVKSAYR